MYTAQTSKTRFLAAANWGQVSPDQKHVAVGAYGNARLLPEGRPLPAKTNEKVVWAPDGSSLLVPIDDMKPSSRESAIPTPGFTVLAVPSLSVLARFEGNEARYVNPTRVVYRSGKQLMSLAVNAANQRPEPVGVVQSTLGCPLVDHYGSTLPVGGTPLCSERFTSTIEHVDAAMTGLLVSDTRHSRTYALRTVVLSTGESIDLVRFDSEIPSSWGAGQKPPVPTLRVLTAPDGSVVCVGVHTTTERSANNEYELRCGPLPRGPLKTIVHSKAAAIDADQSKKLGVGLPLNQIATAPRWLDPGKKILLADNIVDLEAKTIQSIQYPAKDQSINAWRYPLPGGRRYVVTRISPPIMIDTVANTFEPIGKKDGEHDSVHTVPNTDKKLILSDDNVPGAKAESGRWLLWVEPG